MKIIKYCFIIATSCIVFLTLLAGFILISDIKSDSYSCNNYSELADSSMNHQTAPADKQQNSKEQKNSKPINTSSVSDNHTSLLDSLVYNVTLAVNSVNNVLTSGSIFVAILTLFIGLVGLFGFYSLKDEINKQFSHFSSVISKAENLEKNVSYLYQSLNANNRFIVRSNDHLFQSLDAIANQIQDTKIANDILTQLLHNIHITNLFRPSLNSNDSDLVSKIKQAALLYLQENGTLDDIQDLKYVAENDEDPSIRSKALEVILIIQMGKNSEVKNHCSYIIKKLWNCFKSKFI